MYLSPVDQQRSVRYAIYTRQSSLGDSPVMSSCAAQFAICEDFAKARASSAWIWIGQRFDDVGESGADTKRPALQHLLGAIRARTIDKLIIYRLDRLSRSLRDSLDILQALQQNGVEATSLSTWSATRPQPARIQSHSLQPLSLTPTMQPQLRKPLSAAVSKSHSLQAAPRPRTML